MYSTASETLSGFSIGGFDVRLCIKTSREEFYGISEKQFLGQLGIIEREFFGTTRSRNG
jgi:hypothetical protein